MAAFKSLSLPPSITFPQFDTHRERVGDSRVESRGWGKDRRQPLRLACSSAEAAYTSSPAVQEGPPTIDLEFVGPEEGSEVAKVSAVSGEKLLRNIMLDSKLELYSLWGKVMNCGGGGSCGTCIVQILEGQELLNERTDTEYRLLKKKPESWRLACQTIVGDKSNSGKVVVQRQPQKT